MGRLPLGVAKAPVKVWAKYLLLQIPGWVLAGVLLAALHYWLGLPAWAAISAWSLYVAKDFVLYPFLRRAYHADGKTGAETLVGACGTAKQPLAPQGFVWVQGELWQARAEPSEKPIPQGARIRVIAAEGITLIVAEDSPPGERPAP